MAKFGFDVAEVEVSERGDFEIMPKGEYTLKANEAELKDSAKGGTYIACEFEVVKGEYAGRKVWQNFNVTCSSDKGEKIGREQIAGWARACGKPNAQDTDDLLERPFQCKLGIEKGTGGYSDKNKIDGFLMPGASSAPARSAPAPAKSKFDEDAPAKKHAPTPDVEEQGVKKEPVSESPSETKAAPAAKKKNPWDD